MHNRKLTSIRPPTPILIFFGVTVIVRALAAYSIPIFDDAFITLRHARNLAEGLGYIYNPGENILGVTGPLWGILLSPLFWLFDNPYYAVVGLNILIEGAIVAFTMRFFFPPDRKIEAYIFAVLYLISPVTARICVGAMEMNLFLLLSLVAVKLYFDGKETAGIIISASLYFIRPEGIILFGLLSGLVLFERKIGNFFKGGGLGLALLMVGIGVIYSIYGSALPQSLSAKSGNTGGEVLYVLKRFLMSDAVVTASVPLFAVGVFSLGKKMSKRNLILISWFALYLGAYLLKRPQVWTWYPAAVHLVLFIFAGFGTGFLLKKIFPAIAARSKLMMISAVTILLITWSAAAIYFGPSEAERRIYREMIAFGKSGEFSGKSIMASDIGIPGYAFADSEIIDTEGLVSPEMTRYDTYKEKILAALPDYISVIAIESNLDLMQNDDEIRSMYTPVRRFSISGDTLLRPEPGSLDNNWSQDYILYKKNSR